MLCGLDVPTLKNVRLALQTLELLSFPTSRIRFVLNRANSKVGLTKREVEAALKVEVGNEIPSERIVPLSVNRGEAAVLAEPGSDYSKAILELAKSILPQQNAPKAKRRGLTLSRS
jgi:pilus assembly protein CpaE